MTVIHNSTVTWQQIADRIVSAYTQQEVKTLNTSGEGMWEAIKDVTPNITAIDHPSLLLWKELLLSADNQFESEISSLPESDRNILNIYRNCYQHHYIEGKKSFQLMNINHSFATSIAMYLYH